MLRKLLLLIVFVGLTCNAIAQSLRGTVTEAGSGETVPMANVVVKSGQNIVQGGATDFDGNYVISPLSPGTYDVEVSFIGMATKKIAGVQISPSKATQLSVQLSEEGNLIDEIVVEWEKPIIDPFKSGEIKGAEEIANIPNRGVGAIVANTGGVSQVDNGGGLTVRGGRSGQTTYFVDGVKVIGNPPVINNQAMDQVQVITGGVPAEYGDVTSGVISIVTKGPGTDIFGGIELQTSNFLDAYDYSLGEFYFSSPLLWKDEKKSQALVGVFLSGGFSTVKDRSYTRFSHKLKDNVINDITERPLILSRDDNGVNSEYALNHVQSTDFEKLDVALNNSERNFNLQTKFNIQTGKTSNLKIGGTYSSGNFQVGSFRGSSERLLNTTGNQRYESSDLRVYADYQQFFNNETEDGKKSVIENAYYNIHADYTVSTQTREDPEHGDEYWKYLYVGKFTPEYSREGNRSFVAPADTEPQRIRYFNNVTGQYEEKTVTFNSTTGNTNLAYDNNFDVAHYDFQATGINGDRSNYTSQYYDFATNAEEDNLNAMQGSGALINGGNPRNLYSLWDAPGTANRFGTKFDNTQFRLTGAAAGKIGGHELKVGFEFEQRTRRFWSVNTSNLWSTARSLENRHLVEASEFNYEFNGDVNANNQLVLTAIPVIDETSLTGFARNIRSANGIDFVDPVSIDGMDVNNLSIDHFSQEELLDFNIANNYYGYDAYGNKLTGSQPDVNDFLTDSLSNGLLKREIGAFQPIYMAGYIQDKFFVKDLVFNVGVRIDRYDANQQVLKDRYSVFDIRRAGEIDLSTISGTSALPSSIGSDFAVYVDDELNPTVIKGYRDENTWYNAEGIVISDPEEIVSNTGRATPYLQEGAKDGLAKNNGLTDQGFTDYTPEITVMPRVSFNFPITDEALFFAHYDVLTQRPTASDSRLNPDYYLDLAQSQQINGAGTNPDLKPQRTTDYELGFKQALTKTTAFEVSLFYREMRDMIQQAQVTQAYPVNYTQYSNQDFGTVKGMTLKYEMRRVKNFSCNLTYTLQYADGTGSSPTAAANLISAGQPNLRTTLPLNFDSRHQFIANALYSYGRGKQYDGPKSLQKVLEGMSFSLSGNASTGRPYSKHSVVRTQVTDGISGAAPIQGSVNGARLPLNYRFDLKVTKRFDVSLSKNSKKKNPMSVYLQVNNLFDTQNILNVYGFTGNADDDGFLSSAEGLNFAEEQINQSSYEALYGLKVNDPYNYSRPRTIRLGLTLGF
ncbi:MAG: TonB-dependent receptor domain-containing protein [Flavobacteriales bacterium]